jgi:hypothetical protein
MRFTLILALLLTGSAMTPIATAETSQRSVTTIEMHGASQEQHRSENTQMIGMILTVAGMMGLFVSSIYFIVRAFSVSAVWGVFMLLFSGITMLFFCLFEFERARRPLFILLLSIAAIVGGAYVLHLGTAPQ